MPPECDPYLYDSGVDGGETSDAGMSFCSGGKCVPPAPEAWSNVAFVMAWPELPPACPEDAPMLAFEGNPTPPDRACPACSCAAPEGSCIVPTTWTVSSEPCANPNGGVKTNFDAPAVWDGTCTSVNAIAKDKLCGGVPCVRSITITPPLVEEKPCVSHTEGAADLPVLKAWSSGERGPTGRACKTKNALPNCSSQGCGATNSAFDACIMRGGDHACPEGWDGDRHVLYGKIEDTRACTPCGCDPPSGSVCQVKWRTFSDSTCTAENSANDVSVGMMSVACADLDPGAALAGKSAQLINYTKGSCAPSGGKQEGSLMLDEQQTICCLPKTTTM